MSQQECDIRQTHFNEEQKRQLDEFLATETRVGMIMTNTEGKQRKVLCIRYPTGAITHETEFFRSKDQPANDPVKYRYRTNYAILAGREATVAYRDLETGKNGEATSPEWVTWLGMQFHSEIPESKQVDTVPEEFSTQMISQATEAKKKFDEQKMTKTKRSLKDASK